MIGRRVQIVYEQIEKYKTKHVMKYQELIKTNKDLMMIKDDVSRTIKDDIKKRIM